MINVYAATANDYSTNGLLVLDPWCTSARIREKLNGEYTLTLELEINARTVEVVNEMVIKVPAPVRFTPQLDIFAPVANEIWRVNTNTKRLSLRTKPSTTSGRVLHAYKKGTEVVVTDKSNPEWYVVAAPDGRSGYMEVRWLAYVRDEYEAPVVSGVIEEHKTKEQLFRVRSVSSTLDRITIEAQHISYDLRRNYIKSATTKGLRGAEAFPAMMAATISGHEFNAYSDMAETVAEDIKRKNPIEAMFSDGGLIPTAGGEVLRDNFDIYWVQHIGQDRGVSIAYRKNMSGMDVKIDTNGLVTRIIPVGYNKNNEPIYGDPVDSAHINEYAQPYIIEYEYKDVKVGNGYKDAAAVRAEVQRLAALEYDKGIDLPTVSASVGYVDLQNTDVGKTLQAFTGVFLGDTVRIRHEDYRFDIATQINAYEWDVLLNEYVGIELGSKQASMSDVRISPSQIGNSTLAGRKLAVGTISGAELGEGSVSAGHITDDAIENRHIAANSIEADQIKAGSITAGKIAADSITAKEIAAGAITTNELAAKSVTAEKIAAGAITAEKIAAEAITAGKISAGAINTGTLAAGAVTAEKIASKTITAGQIAAGTITAQSGIIANSAIGTAQIADGSITEAKVVSLNADVIQTGTLSAERLLLVGDDGVIYKINAASSGLSMTELSKDQYKKYINGTVIVAKSITAAQIAARTITANEILSGTITAKEINVSDLFASQATINALNAMDISGNTYLRLMVTDAVDDVRMGGTQLIPATKDYSDGWSLWNCETYRNASAAWPEHVRLRQNMSGLSEEWRSSARTPLIRLPDDWQGRELVLSAYLSAAAWANVDKGITWTLCLSNGSTTRGYIYSKYNVVVPGEAKWGADMQYDRQPVAGELVRAWTVYAMDAANFTKQADTTYALTDCTHMFIQFWLRKNGDVRTVAPKLEWGNKPTDWSYAPEDVDSKEANLQSQIDLIPGQITVKVSEVSKDVDALGTRVTSAESTLKLKADSSELSTVKTTVNSLGTRVTEAETSLKLKANQATLTSTANNLQSQIDAVPGKIELAVKEIDEFRAGTTVEITKDVFRATTPEFSVAIVGEDGETNMLTIDETGAQMRSLTAPDVAPRYSGPATLYVDPSATSAQIAAGNYYRSLADALAALSNKWINRSITINLAAGMTEYGTVTLAGTMGSGGITIQGDSAKPAKLVGRLNVYYNVCTSLIRYLNIDSASGGIAVDCAGGSTMFVAENCIFTGADPGVTSYGVRTYRGARADVHDCELYDHSRSLYAQQTGVIQAYSCKGNCKAGVNGGLMHATGTMPDSEMTFAPAKWGGEVFASSVTVDQGSKPTATPAPTAVTVNASATRSYTTSWRQADTIIRQGYYSGMGEWAGCMWFPTASFAGKTVKTASLTLTRQNGSGKGSAVTLTLYGIKIASASGNPLTNAVSYGVIGTIENGETKTFTLPLSAAQALASGTIKGFMLYAGDGGTWNGKNYSTNYCKIDSSGGTAPRLDVTY